DGGIVAKAAGAVVAAGLAWSLYKSVGPLFIKPKMQEYQIVKGMQEYQIVKGDTWFSIAHSHGVSLQALKDANGFVEDDVYAGETISIPK
ncbi:hypothetical protein KP509_19G034500, partial [Ceratopteris richardii]